MSAAFDRASLRIVPDDRVARHDGSVFDLRARRDAAVAEVPDFAALRRHASAVKAHTLDHLDRYLEQFETAARAAGAVVHWAGDAERANQIVLDVLREHDARHVVKSKSILTEECGLNGRLEAEGIEVIDTDLGERIVQLRGEPPSHIMVPAIHCSREEIGALFHQEMGTPAGESDPKRLTDYARTDLRPRFLAADAGITGVNFGLAESGSVVVVSNEGNADLGMSLPPLHIACMGVEKLIPGIDDLAVFLRLLARSATGQPISAYTSVITGPREDAALHIVIVDNGRTGILADSRHRSALACIRCGACLNTCPVYRRAGGYSYAQAVPGPIGAVLAPARDSSRRARELPHASSLCGSCTDVCPVEIDLHAQLLAWRRELPPPAAGWRLAAWLGGVVLRRPNLYRAAGRLARLAWPLLRLRLPGNPARGWLAVRDLPRHPGPSFRARYRRRRA